MKAAIPCCLIFALLLGPVGTGWAQDDLNKPVGPAAPLYDDGKPLDSQQTLVPDDRPLSGALALTLGSSEGHRTFLVPSLYFSQRFDSNPNSSSGTGADFVGVSSFGGSLSLQKKSARSELQLQYEGGALFYTDTGRLTAGSSTLNSSYHSFGISETLARGRWTLLLGNQLTYTPETVFGFGVTGFQLGNLLGLNPQWLPYQYIITAHSPRIGNSTFGQVEYGLSSRTSVTFTGSYGLLRFPDLGNFDSQQVLVSTGYNHVLNRKDTIGVTYTFGRFIYNGGLNLTTHGGQLLYGRRITGRLGLRLAGGAQTYGFDNANAAGHVLWNAAAGLTYHVRRTDMGVNYSRSVGGGSGVLLGSRTDIVAANISRPLSRMWSGSVDFGYSHNASLINQQSFDGEYAGVTVRRQWGRYAGVYFSYNLQHQTNSPACVGCGDRLLRHIAGVGFDWRYRPISLD